MNKRVQDADGYRGTVRYEGPIHSKNGTQVYWGVEWDEGSRGKHDGETDGKRYFQTNHPTSGSFVVPDRVTLGVGIAEALKERYMQNEAADVRVAGEVATSSGNSKSIQLVGVHKIQEKQELSIICKVSLEACKIAHLGTEGELSGLAPNIIELNLGFNLLSSWNEVMKLSRELPNLEHLILSGNVLVNDVSPEDPSVFSNVHVLVMNQTSMSWADILHVCRTRFPALRELYISSNIITNAMVQEMPPPLPSLELLDLSHNQLSDWISIASALGPLPHLKQLVLNGNAIASIERVDPTWFPELAVVSLSDNLLAGWSSIDALNGLKALQSLRLTKNPLLAEMSQGESRMLIVARIQSLLVFNSSEIRPKERQDAEQLYLKRIFHELVCFPEPEHPKVLTNHPRYEQLSALYPDIQSPNAVKEGGPTALARSLVHVTFLVMSMNAVTMDSMEKKLPLNMKVSQVKLLVSKKYGLGPSEHQLSFRTSKKGMPVPLDDDNGEIGYYGVQDGGEILINDA
ncbi:Aste57867_1120 [Aphanomyces stellatus]|uniref:Aste57867_1120 protein n=1 Tax=Aphanomyces stellatus TaxID=120398 RepID=A0A485K736_9STRA|nr:hypothetical protein As57867_001119 [Aphanomyces stellatus]VFT78341.1 Aste57867_1120 [Aphanomyces stellatus]